MKLNAISKYGTLISCVVLLIIALFTWLIKYPDTVPARARLTGANAPKPIIAKQNSRIVKLFKNNSQQVLKGEVIGILESTADFQEVIQLEKMLNGIDSLIRKNEPAKIKIAMQQSFQHLGELQGDYQSFIQTYIPYRDYVLGDYIIKKKQFLQNDISIVNRSKSVLNHQSQLQKKDLGLTQTTMDMNKKMLDEKLISEQEYRELSSQYLQKQMTEPQMKAGYIANDAQVNTINKEIVEIENQALTHKSLFEQAVYQLITKIDTWKQLYLLQANNNGKLVFTSFLQENQNLEAGKILAHIIPENSSIYLETLIPQVNFGKVTVGQKVIVKFDAYPWQEYGTIMGKIDYISPVPADSGYYLAKVVLPKNLKTNYNKEIPYVDGLIAQSEIITKDLRLAESLYFDLVKAINK
ncbi:Hemolysin secretion protein D, plasmid [compost metagenome]